jgi:hypothetical protein
VYPEKVEKPAPLIFIVWLSESKVIDVTVAKVAEVS